MDEELDPGDENVNTVLAQESSELFHVLRSQSPTIIMKLWQMMPSGARYSTACQNTSPAVMDLIRPMLEHFKKASAADCQNFLQSTCMLCEDMPMRLESRLMSVAGYPISEYEKKL